MQRCGGESAPPIAPGRWPRSIRSGCSPPTRRCSTARRHRDVRMTPPVTPPMMPSITLSPVTDWVGLGEQWRELESRADVSFFQSWTWVGCLAAERYDDPVVLQARRGDRTLALGLFNRRRGWPFDTLWLHETRKPPLDSLFIEHNGLLVGSGCGAATDDALRTACLAAARRVALPGQAPGRRQ